MTHGICKLCLKEADLCDSHYVSKALYGLARINGDQPIMMSPSFATLTDRQVKKPLLCFDCEQRFSKNGENYALSLINREDNIFKALELINGAEPRQSADSVYTYFSKEAGIDNEQLAYFAVSTVWRGAVASWNTSSRTATGGLQFGKHEESIRRYLLGETGFPPDLIVRIVVTIDLASRMGVIFPWHSHIHSRLNVFTFVVRGLWFEVAVGDEFPAGLQRTCCVRSPEGIVFLADREKEMIEFAQRFKKTARVDKKLRSLVVE